MVKKYFLLLLSSLVLFAILIPFGGYLYGLGGHHIKASLALIAYSLLTYYWLQQSRETQWWYSVGVIMLLPLLLLYTPIYVRDFEGSLVSLPSTLAHVIGIIFGYIITLCKRPFRIITGSLILLVSLWTTIQGYDLWIHKLNYGNFLGQINEPLPNFSLKDQQGIPTNLTSLRGKFIVLDFWNTGCGVCFQKFPILEQYHQRSLAGGNAKFFAVNIPLTRDKPQDARQAIEKKNYTFPILYANEQSLASLFGVKSYPTVIVISPSQQIIYRGELEGIDWTID